MIHALEFIDEDGELIGLVRPLNYHGKMFYEQSRTLWNDSYVFKNDSFKIIIFSSACTRGGARGVLASSRILNISYFPIVCPPRILKG